MAVASSFFKYLQFQGSDFAAKARGGMNPSVDAHSPHPHDAPSMEHRTAIDEIKIFRPFLDRWYGNLALILASVILLSLSPAPTKQFYLAWVGLVPWLWVIGRTKSSLWAFLGSWLAGILFFTANMWWLVHVSIPGMIALMIYLGLYWGLAALLFRALGWLNSGLRTGEKKGLRTEDSGLSENAISDSSTPSSVLSPQSYLLPVLGIAMGWVALEWLRGNLFTGLPWMYLGHTQSPLPVVCQIADIFGVYGVSFCVAALNALIYFYVRGDRRQLRSATLAVAGLWVASGAYGVFRRVQMETVCSPGPRVLVVQPNYPQDNSGEKGATDAERLRFHLDATRAAIQKAGDGVDLVCWSETMMPAINEEYRAAWRGIPLRERDGTIAAPDYGAALDQSVGSILELCKTHHLNVLTGGLFSTDLDPVKGIFRDRRNSAYLFRSDGLMATERSDKIHLVPFGEFIPFKNSRYFHWIHDIFAKLSPYDWDYTLTAGSEDSPTVMTIPSAKLNKPVRVLVPICFEDIDPRLVAKLFRGENGKRADLIVNLTNDGWFKANQNAQHLQAAIFRSIENRVFTVRSVNTGISGFIDSYGRVKETVPVRTEGTAVTTVMLDSRYTFYSRFGDVFAMLCLAGTEAVSLWVSYLRWRTKRKRTT